MQTILITGSNGFIATHFMHYYAHKYNFICISHKSQPGRLTLEELACDTSMLNRIDVVINLAGANIGDKRWSKKRKQQIISSRITTTQKLVQMFNATTKKPHFISASAIGIYDFDGTHDEDTVIDYNNFANFSQQVTKLWEQTAFAYNGNLTITRFAVVLDKNGGAFKRMLLPFLYGIGGKIATGQQQFCWVSLTDALASIDFIIQHKLYGVYNIVAPQVVSNHTITQTISKLWHRPSFLTMPRWLVKLVFGQMGEELLLNGTHVYPKRLIAAKFPFHYPTLVSCLEQFLN